MVGTAPTSNIFPGAVIEHGGYEYEIGPAFDQGGFGKVFHATRRDLFIPLKCVVKVPLPGIADVPIMRSKFRREAMIVANILHPNVVESIAFWEFTDEELALVQALVEDATKLRNYVYLNSMCVTSVYLQILYALRAMHPQMVHRDLSPSNVLINGSGIVKVIDFGLAKDITVTHEHLTRTGVFFGTPGCMSPEQVSDTKHVDHRTDLFALGKSMTAALQNTDPTFGEPWNLAEPWRAICLRLIAREPDGRYATAQEAIDEALRLFDAHNLPLEDFNVHADEMSRIDVPQSPAWPATCHRHYALLRDIDHQELSGASLLQSYSFGAGFDANGFLGKLEQGSAIQAFNDGVGVSFDDCDPVGSLYLKLYEYLNTAHKEICFRRICNTAVRWHRYALMGNVRSVFNVEKDPSVLARLLVILEEEDPPPYVVHGWKAIPGRDP